jgi:hypothetical protein
MKQSVYAVELVCGSVGVGDGVADTGFISGVDPQPIGTGFALDVFFNGNRRGDPLLYFY